MVFSYRAGGVGTLQLNFTIDDPSVSTTANLTIIPVPRVYILRSSPPQVGKSPIQVNIEIRDPVTNTVISGFSSLGSLDIPE